MADRRLGTTGWLDQIARADLVAATGRDVAQQSKPDRVGQRCERVSKQCRLFFVQDLGAHWRATGDGVERDRRS